MKAFISFTELQEIVKVKTGKVVALAKGDGVNTVKVGYTVEKKVPILGVVRKNVTALITVNGINGMDLDLSYAFGHGIDLIANGVRAFLGDYIEKTDMVAWGENGNQVILHIDKIADRLNIEGVDKVKEHIAISSINIADGGIEATFSLLL